MFATPAYAQSAGGGGEMFTSFVPLILIFVIFYFFLIRPQQKKAKEHKAMVEALRRGDQVLGRRQGFHAPTADGVHPGTDGRQQGLVGGQNAHSS